MRTSNGRARGVVGWALPTTTLGCDVQPRISSYFLKATHEYHTTPFATASRRRRKRLLTHFLL